MKTPKYKENPLDRHERLSLGKPHIYWAPFAGEWVDVGAGARKDSPSRKFCIEQDSRWTPRRKV